MGFDHLHYTKVKSELSISYLKNREMHCSQMKSQTVRWQSRTEEWILILTWMIKSFYSSLTAKCVHTPLVYEWCMTRKGSRMVELIKRAPESDALVLYLRVSVLILRWTVLNKSFIPGYLSTRTQPSASLNTQYWHASLTKINTYGCG